jgi:hypothetical protein
LKKQCYLTAHWGIEVGNFNCFDASFMWDKVEEYGLKAGV